MIESTILLNDTVYLAIDIKKLCFCFSRNHYEK